MKKKLKDLSGNELGELRDLMGRIERLIKHDFSHVQEFLPRPLTVAVDVFIGSLDEEYDRREDLY